MDKNLLYSAIDELRNDIYDEHIFPMIDILENHIKLNRTGAAKTMLNSIIKEGASSDAIDVIKRVLEMSGGYKRKKSRKHSSKRHKRKSRKSRKRH